MASDDKSKGLMGSFFSMDASGKLISLLTVGLVVAVFFVGYFYGQLKQVGGGNLLAKNNENKQVADTAPTQQQAAPEPEPLTDEQWNKVLDNPAAVRGNADAAVVMVEFTDYQCPFCARHFTQTESQLDEKYINDGKVLHVIRDLPLPFHGNAHAAAQAARCAGDQNMYWEMHEALFDRQEEWSTGDPTEVFSGFAGDIGLNVGSFDSCLSSEKYKAAVDEDLALAQEVGAGGTPTFFINGERLVGAQPVTAFEAVIEEAL